MISQINTIHVKLCIDFYIVIIMLKHLKVYLMQRINHFINGILDFPVSDFLAFEI